MIAVLLTEFAKLKRSLVLLLVAAAPTMVAAMAFVIQTQARHPAPWSGFTINALAVWAIFMLPMSVTALTVLTAQIEHGPKAWNHLLALPTPRWRYFAAKALVVLALTAAMSAILLVLLPLAGRAAMAVKPAAALTGPVPWAETAGMLTRMFGASLLMTVMQLWAALRFKSFVPPLILGIGGTFVAVAATGAKQGAFFPWLIPLNVIARDAQRSELALSLGLWGGLALGLVMLASMSRYRPQ